MDRGKNLPPKGSKTKPFSGDFIALGGPKGRAEPVDVKKPSASTSTVPAKSTPPPVPSGASTSDKSLLKRENPLSQGSQIPLKKPKIGVGNSSSFTALGRPGLKGLDPQSPGLNRVEPWEDVAIEVEANDLLNAITESSDDEERIEAILCGSVKQLKTASLTQRGKVEPILALSLLYLAKQRPQYFNTELIVEALLVLLKRDVTSVVGPFKGKTIASPSAIACNLLMSGFDEVQSWPESFIKVFIEDSIGERVWVDREECQGFVENILTAFNTRLPPRNLLQQDGTAGSTAPGLSSTGAASSPSLIPSNTLSSLGLDDETSVDSDNSQGGLMRGSAHLDQQQVRVIPRFQELKEVAESFVMDAVNQQLSRRQQPASDLTTRHFLKFLASTAGLSLVRVQAAQRLEMWLSNQKLQRQATDLLLSICVNCLTDVASDADVLNALLRLRLKSKPLLQSYLTCFKELIDQQSEQFPLVMKLLIYSELSPSRGPNNMAVLAVLVQTWPERSASVLADVFMELLLNRDDYLRALRALLREILRALRHEMPLVTFSAALLHSCLQERRRLTIREFEFKDRLLNSLSDMTTLCIFLAISPGVRESAALVARGDMRDMETFRQFHIQVSTIQREAINWFNACVPAIFEPIRADYVQSLRKVLFLESIEQYYNKDGWPSELERPILMRLSQEVPVMEDTLIKILLIGLSKDNSLSAPDALEIVDQLLRRCAAVHIQGFLMLEANNRDIFDILLRLTAYHYPENIILPQGYTPPKLAISTLYWKAWLMLLMLIAHNPGSLGSEAWNMFPTLRALMEMCITNDFTTAGTLSDQQELQVAAMEKQAILEFETHLAAASTKTIITENNSLLLSQLTSLDPRGPTRRPPPAVIDQLRILNATLRLGHLLCRSRQPDFLLEILHRQGPAQSKPWLADLVESNEGAWNLLPVQCLCEFLLHEAAEDLHSGNDLLEDTKQLLGKRKERRHKQQQLIQHLRLLLTDPHQLPEACREVLDYLMRRLSAQKAVARHQALTALNVVLSPKEEDGEGPISSEGVGDELHYLWLVQVLPTIPHFEAVRPSVVAALRSAMLVETQPQAVAAYLRFLASCALDEPLPEQADLTLDLAQVIAERSSLLNALLPSVTNKTSQAARTLESLLQLFWHYLMKAREPNKESYTWSESQDQVLVQWPSGEAASLHILVVHAMVILLTYGPPNIDQQKSNAFERLLDAWFPTNTEHPQAYLVETSEEALLYPDWLKLRMIRSHVDALVDTALKELEPGQLILFIQSFGIPINSMSKLLHALDRVVRENAFAFVEVDMDKAYIQQLLQVQWARGARGGTDFADIMLKLPPEEESRLSAETKIRSVDLPPILNMESSPSKLPSSKTILNVEHSASTLRQLFDIKTVIRFSQPEKIKAYRALSNELGMELRASTRPSSEALATALDNLLDSAHGSRTEFEQLVMAMERQPAFSCGILRLLTSSASSGSSPLLLSTVRKICQKISGPIETNPSSLKCIVLNFVKNHGGVLRADSTPGDLNSLDLSSKRLERHLQQLASRALEMGDSRSLVYNIINSLGRGEIKNNFGGLLIDWIELLDPEIVTAQPDAEMQLLFGKTSTTVKPPSCRPYALALLVHQASWTTLRKCIHQLLSCRDADAFEPKVVLDFLAALVKVPKLWQGRDKHVPKHQQPENLLCLTQQQLFRLAECIMNEYVQLLVGEETTRVQQVLEERSHLLLSCCGGASKVELGLACDLSDVADSTGKIDARTKAAQQLLLQLYVRAPHVGTRLPKNSCVFANANGRTLLTAVPCALDSMALTLISSLTAPQPGKDGARRMADLETALRKIAATHPLLLLRQFSSLVAALRGRAHLDLSVLRSRNHLNLFSCTLGLAQQLSTRIFTLDHRDALEDLLQSFWMLFGNQRDVREPLALLLQKFLHLLLDFIAASPAAASQSLQQHVPLLHDLQMTHPDMTVIKELLSALSRPRPSDIEEDHQQAVVPARHTIRLGPILARLRQSDNCEELVQVLQDLENVCGRVACAPLEGAVADLRPLMASPNQIVRNMTYMIILRYLKDNPNAAADLLPDYLDCLDSRIAAVVTTALERLPDFLLLCQENGDVLLNKTFNLAVEDGYNTQPNLSEAVMLLQHQTGA